MHRCNLVVLISGEGSNLQAIINSVQSGSLPATITAVISNRPDSGGLNRAKSAGIPAEVVDHQLFDSRDTFDAALARKIDQFKPDLIILAGFMRILTTSFVTRFSGKMLNIHPSLLPKYRGLRTHQKALDANDQQHGASVHFVTPELDGGPVIAQAIIRIRQHDTAESLASRLLRREHVLYPRVIQWFCQGRLKLSQNQTVLDGNPLLKPVNVDTLPSEPQAPQHRISPCR